MTPPRPQGEIHHSDRRNGHGLQYSKSHLGHLVPGRDWREERYHLDHSGGLRLHHHEHRYTSPRQRGIEAPRPPAAAGRVPGTRRQESLKEIDRRGH